MEPVVASVFSWEVEILAWEEESAFRRREYHRLRWLDLLDFWIRFEHFVRAFTILTAASGASGVSGAVT